MSTYKLRSMRIAKADVVGVTPFEKGCPRYIMPNDGRRVKIKEMDVKLIARELKKKQKQENKKQV